ncbi:hypothetical protein JNW90_32605 [Micromonospora sp. STR1s_5]|nr:hypothetical protein [Micromonospora sp. STR1s_5]
MSAVLRSLATLCLLFGCGTVLGFALLVLLFKLGLFAGTAILFYRGLILAVIAAVLTGAILATAARAIGSWDVRPRDAVAAALVSLSLNVAFLVVIPVTIDRSISVFILGQMASAENAPQSADEIRRTFVDGYVVEHHQIERRLDEQVLSGNLERTGAGYRLSPQGLSFVRLAKTVAWLFDADSRFVSPPSRNPANPVSARQP